MGTLFISANSGTRPCVIVSRISKRYWRIWNEFCGMIELRSKTNRLAWILDWSGSSPGYRNNFLPIHFFQHGEIERFRHKIELLTKKVVDECSWIFFWKDRPSHKEHSVIFRVLSSFICVRARHLCTLVIGLFNAITWVALRSITKFYANLSVAKSTTSRND